MEEQKITQHPPDKALDKTSPQAETNFGDDAFDGTPIKRGHFGGLNEWVFSLMRPKKKVIATPRQTIPKGPGNPVSNPPERLRRIPDGSVEIRDPVNNAPVGYTVNNSLFLRKKTLAERVRDQIRYPVLKSSVSIVTGLALAIFAVGAYLLYSALPSRPDLVIGIILVSLAGNVIMNNR